jgi:hypothetical protein
MKRWKLLDQIYSEISVVSAGEEARLLRSSASENLDKTSELGT